MYNFTTFSKYHEIEMSGSARLSRCARLDTGTFTTCSNAESCDVDCTLSRAHFVGSNLWCVHTPDHVDYVWVKLRFGWKRNAGLLRAWLSIEKWTCGFQAYPAKDLLTDPWKCSLNTDHKKHLNDEFFKSTFYQHLSIFTNIYQHLSIFTNIYQHLPIFTNIYQHLSIFTNIY